MVGLAGEPGVREGSKRGQREVTHTHTQQQNIASLELEISFLV